AVSPTVESTGPYRTRRQGCRTPRRQNQSPRSHRHAITAACRTWRQAAPAPPRYGARALYCCRCRCTPESCRPLSTLDTDAHLHCRGTRGRFRCTHPQPWHAEFPHYQLGAALGERFEQFELLLSDIRIKTQRNGVIVERVGEVAAARRCAHIRGHFKI